MSEEPTITVSKSRKINLGNYESADVFVSIIGIKAGATPEDIAPLLISGKFGWDLAREALVDQIRVTKERNGQ